MGDTYRRVQPGEPLAMPARVYNELLALLSQYGGCAEARRGPATPGTGLPGSSRGVTVSIRNDSGQDVPYLGVLALDGIVFPPADNEAGFLAQPVLSGAKPTSDHAGRFAVLLAPAADGAVGPGCVLGVVPVRLYVADESAEFADLAPDRTGYLQTSSVGAAEILWKEAGESLDENDLKWAVVRLARSNRLSTSRIWIAQVTAVYNVAGAPWTDYVTDGWQAYVTANPVYGNGTPDTGTTLYLKLTADPAGAEAGFRGVEVDDQVGYVMGPGIEDVPGVDPATPYDGWVLPHGGGEGATFEALTHLDGGPGIDVDEDWDPFAPKVSVDLAAVPGLEFIGAGDAGRLAVLPDGTHGITVAAAGVQVLIDLGLQFDGDGNVEVKPDTARGVAVDAGGVYVKVNTAKGVDVDVDGVKAKLEADKGLEFGAGGGAAVKVDSDGGLQHDADGLRIKLAPTGVGGSGLELSTDGLSVAAGRGLEIEDNSVHVELATDPGLEFDDSGEDACLRAKPNTAKGLQRTADGLEVVVTANEGLEFESGGGLGMAKPGPHAYTATTLRCSIYIDKNGRVMGWYKPIAEPPYDEWYSPWGYPEP